MPTFGNMPLWLTLPTVGSAHSVQNYQKTHGGVLETLRRFDTATAATRIEIPMLVAVARFDPAVAPPCQFSVANGLPSSNHHETVILDAGHFDYPGSEEQYALLAEKVRRLFGVGSGEIIGTGTVHNSSGRGVPDLRPRRSQGAGGPDA